MMQRPRRSSLFPYTTLFRSDGRSVAFIGGLMSDEGVTGGDIYVVPAAGGEARDRKSTRLNSSHSQISYAVFCLKKKNNPIEKLWRWLRQDVLNLPRLAGAWA